MVTLRPRSGLLVALLAWAVAVTMAATASIPADATPMPLAPRADYPSWDQVAAARNNQASTATTIATLNQLLAQLQADSARLGDVAIKRAAESDAAQSALASATESATALARQSDAAAQRAYVSTEHAAAVAAALYRLGGADLGGRTLFADSRTASNLLYQLGALDKLGARLTGLLNSAQTERNQAAALRDQSAAAQKEQARLSTVAKSALAAAQSALGTANAALSDQQAHLDQLYAQLASLKNTTAQVEQAYAIGQQQSNAGSGSDGSAGSPGDGSISDVPSSANNNPAAAQAFAYSVLASHGFGPEQNSCLLWLWNRESGWRTNAYNPAGLAYGIPQALPGSKMAAVGADWRTNYQTQVSWGIIYIIDRYDTPCGAWAHSQRVGWY